MNPRWRFFLLGYLIALPNALLGLALAALYRPKSVRWSDGCLEIEARGIWGSGVLAQTHGWVIFYAAGGVRESATVRVHERVHVVQAFVLGPLFWVAYVGTWLWALALGRRGARAYWEIPFERWARDAEGRWWICWGAPEDAAEKQWLGGQGA